MSRLILESPCPWIVLFFCAHTVCIIYVPEAFYCLVSQAVVSSNCGICCTVLAKIANKNTAKNFQQP